MDGIHVIIKIGYDIHVIIETENMCIVIFKHLFGDKFHLLNDITAYKSSFEQYLLSVDYKIYVSRDNFKSIVGSPKGYTINMSLGFSLLYKEGKAKQKNVK